MPELLNHSRLRSGATRPHDKPEHRGSRRRERRGGVRTRRDDVSASVGVDLNWPDRLALLQVQIRVEHPRSLTNAVKTLNSDHTSRRKDPGLGGEEPDHHRTDLTDLDEVVSDRSAERLTKRDLDHVNPDRVKDEIGHLTGRNPCRHLDDKHVLVPDEQLRERDPVTEPESAHSAHRNRLGLGKHFGRQTGWEPVNPADAETDSGGTQAIRERQQADLATPRDSDRVQLNPLDVAFDDRRPAARKHQGAGKKFRNGATSLDSEDAPLPTRIDRLDDHRQTDLHKRTHRLLDRPDDSKRWLWHPVLGQTSAHRRLIGHPAGDLCADTREAESLRRCRRCRHRPITADSSDAIHPVTARNVDERPDITEIDDLGYIRLSESNGKVIAVGHHDLEPGRPGVSDRGKLRNTPTKNQHRLHGSDAKSRRQSAAEIHSA